MPQSIVENDEVHLLGRELLIVLSKLLLSSFTNVVDGWAGFIDEWGFSNQLIVFVVLIVSLEIGKEVVSPELLIFIAE